MAHHFKDKRGPNQELLKQVPLAPKPSTGPASSPIVLANADGSIKEVAPSPDVLVLSPFPDGTCVKMVPLHWPGRPEDKPANYEADPQFAIINSAKQKLAVARNGAVANLLCDGVNVLFAAQEQADAERQREANEGAELAEKIIAGGKTK